LPVGAEVGCEDRLEDDGPAWLAEWSWVEDGGALELPLLPVALALDP